MSSLNIEFDDNFKLTLTKGQYTGLLIDSLEAEIFLDCQLNEKAVAQKLIRTLEECQAQGDNRFNELWIRVEGTRLVITRQGTPTTRRIHCTLYKQGDIQYFVYWKAYDIGPDSEQLSETRAIELL